MLCAANRISRDRARRLKLVVTLSRPLSSGLGSDSATFDLAPQNIIGYSGQSGRSRARDDTSPLTHFSLSGSSAVTTAYTARCAGSFEPRHFCSRRTRKPTRSFTRRPPYSKTKLAKEIPRLCRGGSKSLTSPAVAPQAPIDETSSVSRQAHAQSPIDGRQ